MDPPEETSYSFNRQRSHDPPEDTQPYRPTRSAFMNDDNLDEFEIEGLVMTSMPNGRASSVGVRRAKSSTQASNNVTASTIEMCSTAWEPRNRARSSIAVLFGALILLIMLTRNDSSAWHKVHMSDRDAKNPSKPQITDPLSKLTPEQRHKLLTRIYGYWGFYDGAAEDRPQEPYMTVENAGIYLDMKGDDFPEESWQVDAVYVNHWLDAATKLVRRGQEAIFATYRGHGIVNISVEEVDGDVYGEVENPDQRLADRLDMFHLDEIDLSSVTSAEELLKKSPSWQKRGGWTTSRSMDGLERRLLHAMMTNSNFTIVVTGSWQNMGYGGNHGWQSMAGVLDQLLSGVFEKLGMKLVVRAIGLPPKPSISTEDQVGRSTLESSLGWSSIYGSDVDMVVWDDHGSIEGGKFDDTAKELFDFFARQALLSGPTNIPFIWGGDFEVLRNLHELADADIGMLGNGMSGVPESTDDALASSLPWAAQYLNCPHDMQVTCQSNANKFMSQCWESTLKAPPETQSITIPVLPTAVGWRMHQLKGYTLGYNLLAAILDSLDVWSEKTIYEGHPLSDENWHMEEYTKNIQMKVMTLTEANAPHCYKLKDKMQLPVRLCNQKLQGRTEYTPRANPSETSLQSVVVPTSKGIAPSYELQGIFEGMAWENPVTQLPAHAVDALEVLELGKNRRRLVQTQHHYRWLKQRQLSLETGDGWKIINAFPQNDCNGSYSPASLCGRVSTSTCLMEGHHGSLGYISGDESTGWLSMMVPSLESGYVAVNLKIGDVNDQTTSLDERLTDSFTFEYAIDEQSTFALDKSQFIEKIQVFNGLGLITILDDTNWKADKPVKISIRVVGCSTDDCRLNISHLYWA